MEISKSVVEIKDWGVLVGITGKNFAEYLRESQAVSIWKEVILETACRLAS